MTVKKRLRIWITSNRNTPSDSDDRSTDDPSHPLAPTPEEQFKNLKHRFKHLKRQRNDRPFFKTSRFLFPLGILLGVVIGLSVISQGNFPILPAHLQLLLEEYDFSLQDLPQRGWSGVSTEWHRFRRSIPEPWKFVNDGREFMVGEEMNARGLQAKFPVVLIPGIISTGLESWSTSPQYRSLFRQKVWGGFSMISQVMFNKEKWMSSLMLDPITGLDPPGVKVRAAEGLDAASNFMQGYWIWSKIIENLAAVNYDTNNLYLAPYDWRLSLWNLEERDGYFSKLKSIIEGFKKRQKKKCVVVAHSMGSTVFLYFLKWVESPEHGGGGPDWVENHVESFVSIAGTHLGVTKAIAALLSGEMKDTVQLNPLGAYVLERFFSKKERQELFRSWVGSACMWIKGGNAIWGNSTLAPDDSPDSTHTHGELIAFRPGMADGSLQNLTAVDAGPWILQHTPTSYQKMLATNYSFGMERNGTMLGRNDRDHTKWSNPLESRLPNAPSMKIFCVYGHGKDTERSYLYSRGNYELDKNLVGEADATCSESSDFQSSRPLLNSPLFGPSWIDNQYTDESINPKIVNGVKIGEGDGTVSLLSLGAMCVEGWKRKRWNPAGIHVITVELPHRPVPTIPRGGGTTADHVDILGSTRLNEIILKVATGASDEIHDSYVSNIREYSKKIEWDEPQ